MGCTASSEVSRDDDSLLELKRQNDQLNEKLNQYAQRDRNQIKLLLLGSGESGKSTVLKQMRLLHSKGFTKDERLKYANVIWADTVQSMKILIYQARKFKIPLQCDEENSDLQGYKNLILSLKSLDLVDTDKAGGKAFLNDYVVRYSSKSEQRRQKPSSASSNPSFWNINNLPEQVDSAGNILAEDEIEKIIEEEELDSKRLLPYNQSANAQQSDAARMKVRVAEAIQALWENDSGIRQCMARSNEFQLEGSAVYYFENIHKFTSPDYLCSDEDILKGRIKTTGISQTKFSIRKFNFLIVDVGGQRSERRKWMNCFKNTNVILFVVAISEYDQMLFEDESVNRMEEAMMLFYSICNSRLFYHTPIILFLNKIDILKTKLLRSPLNKWYPDYNGKSNDLDAACNFFQQKFTSLNKTGKQIYTHFTCATDTTSMKFVLTAITDMIISENLSKSGII